MKIQNSMLKKLTAILLVVAMMFSFSSVALAFEDEDYDLNFSELVVKYYDDAYEYAYAYAGTNGYIDTAKFGIETAIDAVNTAKAFVNGYAVDAKYEKIRTLMVAELDEIAATLELIDVAAFDALDGEALEALLALVADLEDDVYILTELAYEIGLNLDPYVAEAIKAVSDAAASVDAMITEMNNAAYAWLEENVLVIPDMYLAWVEEVGQKVDVFSAEIGQLVRDYLIDTPAEASAIIYAYGEAAVAKLVSDAVAAYGDIETAIVNLALVMTQYGETIYNDTMAVPSVQEKLAELEVLIEEAKELAIDIYNHPVKNYQEVEDEIKSGVDYALNNKREALGIAYAAVVAAYEELYPVVMDVIAANDKTAALAFDAAVDAMLEVLAISGEAADGYHTWLVGHVDALGAELLALLLGNTCDFIHNTGAVIDEMIWNLLGKIDEAIKDHVSEKFEELKEKLLAYGIDLSKDINEQIMALLETIAEDYDRCLYNATHAEYCICGGTHNYVTLGGKLTAGDSYADLFAAALEAESADSVVNPIDAVYSDDTVLLTAENLVSYVESKKEAIAEADIITYNMDAADTITVLMNAMEGGYVDWTKYADAETLAIAEKVMAEVYALLAEKYDAAMLEAIDPIAEILVYAAVTYGVENIKALETITTINSDALVVVIGMVNPFAGVTIDYVGQKIDLGELFDYAIEATDLYNELYAMITGKVTFVSAAGAETVTAAEPLNIVVSKDPSEFGIGDIEELTKLMEQIEYLLSGAGAYLTAEGQNDVYEAIVEAVALDGEHDYVFIQTYAPTTSAEGFDYYECSVCGAPKKDNFVPKLEEETPNMPYIPAAPAEPEHFNCDGGEGCHCNDFEDLDYTMWYHQGVCYMIENGYMIGIGDNKWGPEQVITRAEIATILWRIAGSKVVDYAMDFSDVEADMWYTEAIEWAVSEEIFLGYGDGTFGPNDQITREQMVTVMYRFELDNGKKITADFDMATLSDADEISDWAVEAMTWAFDCGLILGTDADVLTASPLKTATRAEVAMIFYRKLDNLLK